MEQAKISSNQGTQAPHAARNRQGGDATAGAASTGGFFALLSALDDAGLQAGGLGDGMGADANGGAELSDAAPDALLVGADASAMAAWQGLVAPDGGGAQQQSLTGGAALASGGVSAGAGALIGDVGKRQGMVAETALLDGAADFKDTALQGPVAGYGRILSRMQSALAQRATVAGNGGAPEGMAGRLGAGGAMQQFASATQQTLVSAAHGAEVGVGGPTGQPGITHTERATAVASGAVLPSDNSTAGVMTLPGAVRAGDTSSGGRAGDGQPGGGAWAEGATSASSLEAGSVEGAPVFGDPALAGAEELVADQVAYWVNQKTQNAEMTLHRDGQPVEVSVSLSGNEAHVTFRSDQPETRDLLDRSMMQLSDLLRSEGLVLSGMSVGTSGREGAGGGDSEQPRNRDGARQAQVVSAAPAGTVSGQRVGAAVDHRVDVFV